MADLSVLIPARNERWLARTVEDLLSNIRGDTEIIVVLDGAWADPPLPVHERVTVLYNPEAVGQRAATNQAARIAQGKWLMKLDAHCSVDEGFDVKLLEVAEGNDDWTLVPLMKNLHAFDRVCRICSHRSYQGPISGEQCESCGAIALDIETVWRAKDSPKSTSYCFTPEPKFAYFGEFKHRPEGQGDVTETMSLQGSCFMLTRERYWALDICDESLGSWGSQGIEVACKSWLSGGRVVCVQSTWYGHLFRTQGGDFSFPYPLRGSEVQAAKQGIRALFFGNEWPQQVHPLSWLIEKFWPVEGWTDEDLAAVRSSESRVADADSAAAESVLVGVGEEVPSLAVSLSGVVSPLGSDQVFPLSDLPKVVGIAAGGIAANEVVEDEVGIEGLNEPGIHDPVNEKRGGAELAQGRPAVSVPVPVASPDPAPSWVNRDVGEESCDLARSKSGDRERIGDSHDSASFADSWSGSSSRFQRDGDPPILSKGLCYYTDNRLPVRLAKRVQSQLLKAELPIVSVSLKPMSFGQNVHLPGERGAVQMLRQILVGLETLDTDVAFLVEHDCVYHPSHFEFTPERDDRFYYNVNVWQAILDSGLANRVDDRRQVSGLCASRELLLAEYRDRLQRVEAGESAHSIGYEPGTRDGRSETWESPFPNVDLRHGGNLTVTKRHPDEFRNRRFAQGWHEVRLDEVPGWDDLDLLILQAA